MNSPTCEPNDIPLQHHQSTARPLSIVQVCAPAAVGGLERVLQGLAIGLRARGHDVTVVATTTPGQELADLWGPLEAHGVRIVSFECGARAYVDERRRVSRFLESVRPDVVHSHGYRSDLLHHSSARRHGAVTVTTIHGSSRLGGLSRVFEWVHERSLRRFDAVVAVSEPISEHLLRLGVPTSRLRLIPNAWTPMAKNLDRRSARGALRMHTDGVGQIGWIGRLVPVKGADIFLRALAQLPDLRWDAHLIGDGPERASLETLATALGISARVRFHGALGDAGSVVRAFDMFVLSSRSEGTPVVLLEAMGAGVPVIATAVGGVPQLLGDAGWLVRSDSPATLAQTIRRALSEPQQSARFAQLAEDRIAQDFSRELWLDRYEAVYAAAIQRAK